MSSPAEGDAVLRLRWSSEAECGFSAQALAQALAPRLMLGGSCLIALHGTLGAGKTTFTRHLLRSLGVQGRIKSPSYAVVEPHDAPGIVIWHFDFYRFADPREWEDAGFRDLFASAGLKIVEWPEKAGNLMPQADIELTLVTDEQDARVVTCRAGTPAGEEMVQALSRTLDPTMLLTPSAEPSP